jgi:tocopherol cyclase
MKRNRFEGWYFKHQIGDETIAFIPGRASSGAFIQIVANRGSWFFDVSELNIENNIIFAGNCTFSEEGAAIGLPGIRGNIQYGPFRRLSSDIMGPFRFLPMECRHGILSMRHTLSGTLNLEGRALCFNGGIGYIEKDSGRSFPKEYLWLQSNSFEKDCDVMLSIAKIPFLFTVFNGCLCSIIFEGKEYRLATYKGVKLLSRGPEHIRIVQGDLSVEIYISGDNKGHELKSPVRGNMTGAIRESNSASARICLRKGISAVFDLDFPRIGFEYVTADNAGPEPP